MPSEGNVRKPLSVPYAGLHDRQKHRRRNDLNHLKAEEVRDTDEWLLWPSNHCLACGAAQTENHHKLWFLISATRLSDIAFEFLPPLPAPNLQLIVVVTGRLESSSSSHGLRRVMVGMNPGDDDPHASSIQPVDHG